MMLAVVAIWLASGFVYQASAPPSSAPLEPTFSNRCHPPFPIGATHLFQSVPPTFSNRCHPPIEANPQYEGNCRCSQHQNHPLKWVAEEAFFNRCHTPFPIGATHRLERTLNTWGIAGAHSTRTTHLSGSLRRRFPISATHQLEWTLTRRGSAGAHSTRTTH